jgi:hypothetical protein
VGELIRNGLVGPEIPPGIEDNTAAIVQHAGGAPAAIDTR